jgi:hypothetical protein
MEPTTPGLSLAGSNTVSYDASVRLASTDKAWNVNLKHIIIKRLTDPHGPRGNQIYETDRPLMERLAAFTKSPSNPYPEPEGPGTGTNRVRVSLLSNDPDEVVSLRREFRIAAPLQCTCKVWRQKTEAEAVKEGLSWPPDDDDREAYFISKPGDGDGFGCSWHVYEDSVIKVAGKGDAAPFEYTKHSLVRVEPKTCNPHTCPYTQASRKGAKCKPVCEINVRLGDWAGGELAFVHAESWATVRRIRTSLARIFELTGGKPAGVEVDLVLGYTKPQAVPGESGKRRHPYWVFDILHGMTETEFTEYAIQRRQKVQADRALLASLNDGSAALLAEAQTPWRVGALLPEFRPEVRSSVSNALLDEGPVGRLCREFGMGWPEAQAMVAANEGDLEGLFARLAVPDENADDPAETVSAVEPEPDVIEGDFEADGERAPIWKEIGRGDCVKCGDNFPVLDFYVGAQLEVCGQCLLEAGIAAQDDAPVIEREAEPEPVAAVEPELEVIPDPEPEPAPAPAPAPIAAPVAQEKPRERGTPMFAEMPATGFAMKERFGELDEIPAFAKLLPKAWKMVTNENKASVPTLAVCKGDQAVFTGVLAALLDLAEEWWDNVGRDKHEGGGQDG